MKYNEEIISGIFSFICILATWFWGVFDGGMKLLTACVIIDYALGVTAAAMNGELCSQKGFKGIGKKLVIFALVGISNVAGRELLGGSMMLRDAVIYFYVANEGLSIIENADKANVPIPDGLKKLFANLNKDNKDNDNKNNKNNKKLDNKK